MSLQPGTRFGAYEIVAALGAGGMGEVFLAFDPRLQRQIAIKVLPAGFATDATRVARFEREARAVSSLNHPHILTLFDVGRIESTYFMATEYVDGRTLRAELRQRGRLPTMEALEIARQCAVALAAAHAAGIVHRDVKPENVMLRADGYVKVLDFGLASIRDRSGPEDETSMRADATGLGVVVGTTGYLSPEQARGLPVDARSDIFALGVVLFEMLTGRAPFAGATPSDTIASILRSEPPPLSTLAGDVPADLELLVHRMLAKDPGERPSSMAATATQLEGLIRGLSRDPRVERRAPRRGSRTWLLAWGLTGVLALAAAGFVVPRWFDRETDGAAMPQTPIRSLAVLPFRLFGFPDSEAHLGLGMADALVVKLTSLRELTVRPTTSVERYQDQSPELPAVAHALDVDAVLTGNVQRASGRTRVTVQLVRVVGNEARAVWSDEFRADTADPFDVQERLAAQLLANLPVQITGDERTQFATQASTNPRALRLYTEGRYFLNRRTGDSVARALDLFTQAATADPRYARAHLGRARALNALIESGAVPQNTTLPEARSALNHAIELDPALGEAYGLRSLMDRVYDWRFDTADADSQRSLDLSPNHPEVLQWRGVHLLAAGRGDEALAVQRRAVEIDPLDLLLRGHLLRAQYLTGRFEDAIATGSMLLDGAPDLGMAHQWVGLSMVELKRLPEGIQSLERALAVEPRNPERAASLAYAYARAGRGQDAERLLAPLSSPNLAYHRALVHVALGQTDAALDELERAWKDRDGFFANRARLDPRLDPIRGEPRMRRLLEQLQ